MNNMHESTADETNLSSYIVGFATCIALTVAAFTLVQIHVSSGHVALPHSILIPTIAVLAVIQLIVQAFCFLHLGSPSRRGWIMTVFVFMLILVGTVVGGSLWIMSNLNTHMSPAEMNAYMENEN